MLGTFVAYFCVFYIFLMHYIVNIYISCYKFLFMYFNVLSVVLKAHFLSWYDL